MTKGSTNYTWTRGRLLASVGNTTFEYDYKGKRTKKGTTKYYYDGDKLIAEVRSNNTLYYFYDAKGVCGFRYNGKDYEYIKNLFGDIVGIAQSVTLVARYEYDIWGNCTVAYDPEGIGTINPFRYRGYYFDTESGLYYLMSRYYDPEIGQFISMDTPDYLAPDIIGGVDLYSYCRNNPVMYVDSTGHEPEWWHWVAAGLAVACGVVVMVTFAGAIGGIIGASATVVNAMMISAGLATATAGAMNLFTQATNRVEDIDVGSLLADMTVSGIFGMVTGGISSVLSTFVSGGVGAKLLADMATQGVLNAGLSMISYLLQVPFSGEGLTLEGLTMPTTTGFISGCAFKLPPLRSFLLAVGFELANYAETIFANLKKLIR